MAKQQNSERDTGLDTGLANRASSAFSQFSGGASGQIDNSPLVALAGGIALGALIASVLPQSERETGLLQPVGSKITNAGRAGIDRAREAGKAKVDELAGDKLREYFGFGGNKSTETS